MIDLSTIKELIINGIKIVELHINGILIWKGGYKNWVKYSTESDGVTIYNGGLGYRENYRLSSDGSEKTGTNGVIAGFIPIKPGDVVRFASSGKIINWPISNATNCIHYYNSSKESVGRFMGAGTVSGVCTAANSVVTEEVYRQKYRFTVPNESSIEYVRVGVYWPNGPDGENFIVTVNEEIV